MDMKSQDNSGASLPKSQTALREEVVLKFWNENKIFEKSLAKNSGNGESKKNNDFVFYDGPPFATGLPHYGHIVPGTIKDVIPRFKTMQGKNVRRIWGWDCHGLPIENLIEKELGLSTKRDIVALGIEKFNQAARNAVLRYEKDWKEIIPRTGRWVNMEDSYKTMDTNYTESVWWSFKTLSDKGLVYEGYKVMPYCPRCGTTLSNFEVNQGYKDITDISVYVKFALTSDFSAKVNSDPLKPAENSVFVLAWTTTPWTLPANVALAINPKEDYVKATIKGEHFILAKARLSALKDPYFIIEEFKGEKLIGKSYHPVFDYYANLSDNSPGQFSHKENGWKIYGADFVTMTEGTGIVHIAPAFGSDDMELQKRENLPFIQHVNSEGRFKDEVTDFKGLMAKPKQSPEQDSQQTDIEIIKFLARQGFLFAKEKIVHSYPHCWRCDTPLLNSASSSWFIKVTALKEQLLSANQKVNWIPSHIQEGRFGKWLEGARDWAVSRSRFWGAPLPVWKCQTCKKIEVLGSISSMKNKLRARNTYTIIRHGEAESNVMGIISSDPTVPHHLTERGRGQVETSAMCLKKREQSQKRKIDLIVSSPFVRTRETAQLIAEVLGMDKNEILYEDNLREVNAGEFTGKSIKAYHDFFLFAHDAFTKVPPNGENLNHVRDRVGKALYYLDEKYQGKNILIVTHDTPAWLLFACSQGLTEKQAIVLRGKQSLNFLDNAVFRDMPFLQLPHNEHYEIDLHRPYIDEVTFTCACGGEMERIPEVFDTWYDSGSMSFAQYHYPFENKDIFNPQSSFFNLFSRILQKSKGFPADFIAEGLDQTRGWFYTSLVLSIGLFAKAPYKTVVVSGLVLASDGKKLAKRLKNYTDVLILINKYSADALRYFLMASPVVHSEDVALTEKEIDDVNKKLIMRLDNVVSFYEMYAGEVKTDLSSSMVPVRTEGSIGLGGRTISPVLHSTSVLDVWVQIRLNETLHHITIALEKYELDKSAWPIESFIDDLSTWYLRRSRDRFKGGESAEEKQDKLYALETMHHVLIEFSKMIAPLMPFTAEDIYQRVKRGNSQKNDHGSGLNNNQNDPESVHLCHWPKINSKFNPEDSRMMQKRHEMAELRAIVSLGLESRSKANIKVRQPLSLLSVKETKTNAKIKLNQQYIQLIKDELNVKEVIFDASIAFDVVLDTIISPELKEEGQIRELMRAIAELRKERGFNQNDSVILTVSTDEIGKTLIEKYTNHISKAIALKEIRFVKIDNGSEAIKIDNLSFILDVI
jgi:isoleucyl-tRNA synthetase